MCDVYIIYIYIYTTQIYDDFCICLCTRDYDIHHYSSRIGLREHFHPKPRMSWLKLWFPGGMPIPVDYELPKSLQNLGPTGITGQNSPGISHILT